MTQTETLGFFAGVDEDALDLAFQEHFTSSHDAAPEYNFQDACSTPLEEFALEHEMPKNAGSDSVGDVQENVSDNIEIITETLDRVEQPVDSDHTSLMRVLWKQVLWRVLLIQMQWMNLKRMKGD